MEYKIITAGSIGDIELAVNEHLKGGWEISGGVAAIWTDAKIIFFQALLKEPDFTVAD